MLSKVILNQQLGLLDPSLSGDRVHKYSWGDRGYLLS